MDITRRIFRGLAAVCRLMLVAAALALGTPVRAADLQLPTLKTRQGTYTNVVVTAKTKTDIFIRHERGIANVKLADIQDDAALEALGLLTKPAKVEKPPPAVAPPPATNAPPQVEKPAPRRDRFPFSGKMPDLEARARQVGSGMVVASLALVFLSYFFVCYCLMLICQKAGHEPGLLVWLPFFQMIPALRAAGMSPWWLVASLLPGLNLVTNTGVAMLDAGLAILFLLVNLGVWIAWCFKITAARGKSVLVAIALLLPVFNLCGFLYLAFSSAED